MALGIAAVGLIAIFGLLPIGAETNRNAASQTATSNILASIAADMRATPNALTTSGVYHVTFGTPQTLYFDDLGSFAPALTSTSKYRVDIAYPANSGLTRAPTYVKLIVTWPAQADPASAPGKVQLFAAFDRH